MVIILAALLQMVVPLLGHATITKVLRYLAYVFIVFFAVLAGFTFNKLHLSTFHAKPVSFAVWTTALVLIISVGGLGWTENGNDYSRYLPRNTPAVADVLGRDPGRRDPVGHPGDAGRARLHDHHQDWSASLRSACRSRSRPGS